MADVKMAIGIDLGGTDIKAGLIDSNGQIHLNKKKPTDAQKGGEFVLNNLIGITSELLLTPEAKKSEILGIGVGSPGVIDPITGKVIDMSPNLPGWTGTEIKASFEKEIKLPTFADNDADVGALGEYIFGAGKGKNSLICLTLGTGVGGGYIKDGKIFHGGLGGGEFGHTTIEVNGRNCNCGGKGCLESYASANAIAEYAREVVARTHDTMMEQIAGSYDKITSKIVYDSAIKGDNVAVHVIEWSAKYLGSAISNFINILAPDIIVLGGGASALFDFMKNVIYKEMQMRVYSKSAKETPVVKASLGEEAGIVGAAALAFTSIKTG